MYQCIISFRVRQSNNNTLDTRAAHKNPVSLSNSRWAKSGTANLIITIYPHPTPTSTTRWMGTIPVTSTDTLTNIMNNVSVESRVKAWSDEVVINYPETSAGNVSSTKYHPSQWDNVTFSIFDLELGVDQGTDPCMFISNRNSIVSPDTPKPEKESKNDTKKPSKQHDTSTKEPKNKSGKRRSEPVINVGDVGYTFWKEFKAGWYTGKVTKTGR